MPSADPSDRSSRNWLTIGSVGLAAAAVIAIGAVLAVRGGQTSTVDSTVDGPPAGAAALDAKPVLLFRNTSLGDDFGRLAVVPADEPAAARTIADLDCERVDFRAGTGVCLQADRGADTTYRAIAFDADFERDWTIELAGPPSRVRISPDGSVAGISVFVTDHSYVDEGFSTQTTIVDVATGESLADLELDYSVRRDGEIWVEEDFNFWGVTFIDDESFYATLATGGRSFLIRGDTETRTLTVESPDAECPSLSPDGTHLAFKLRESVGDQVFFQLAVMELATGRIVTVAETRSIDDQVAWLDADTLMYGVRNPDSPAERDTWTVPIDGSGAPELLIAGSWSTRLVP